MTEQTKAINNSPETVKFDRLLQWWVLAANKIEEPVNKITLCTGGVIVTGEIIGAKTYIRLNSTKPSDSEEANFFKEIVEDLGDEDLYIHLQNANIILSSGFNLPSQGTVLWRGRLDRVDGWFYGLLGSQ